MKNKTYNASIISKQHDEESKIKEALNVDLSNVSTRLIPYFTSHNTMSDGYGRKCHIGYFDDGKPICGMNHPQYDTSPWVKVTEDWVVTGLHSEEVCIRCAKKALSIFEASKNEC